MVNQKNRAIALKMLVTRRIFSFSSRMPATISAAVCAQSPNRTRVSAKARSVCIGTCPAMSWKDVGLGQVVERGAVPNGDGGGKLAVSQAVEEEKRGDVAAHRFGLEPGERAEKSVDVLQPRHPGGIEAEAVDALEEARVGVPPPPVLHPGEEPAPGIVIGFGVELVRLMDVQPPFLLGLLDERRLGRRQATARPRAPLELPPSSPPLTSVCTSTPRFRFPSALTSTGCDSPGLQRRNLDLLVGDHGSLARPETRTRECRGLGATGLPCAVCASRPVAVPVMVAAAAVGANWVTLTSSASPIRWTAVLLAAASFFAMRWPFASIRTASSFKGSIATSRAGSVGQLRDSSVRRRRWPGRRAHRDCSAR